jgi:alkylhydroperoxidase family enzyme
MTSARISPVDLDTLDAEQAAALAPFIATGRVLNIFRTLARAPKALTRFNQWGGYILSRRNSLSERDRELVILRTGFNCKSGYEWTQHVAIGLRAGLTAAEVERIKAGPEDSGWAERDRAMLRATDDLHRDFHVSDANWAALDFLEEKGKMDLVMSVAQYTQVSMMLNSFGVQLDAGQMLDPELKAY